MDSRVQSYLKKLRKFLWCLFTVSKIDHVTNTTVKALKRRGYKNLLVEEDFSLRKGEGKIRWIKFGNGQSVKIFEKNRQVLTEKFAVERSF